MSHVPFGYIIENGEAKVDEKKAESIKALFTAFIECKSMRAAAAKAGLDKANSTIGRIIKNKVYLGTDFYPQIIDEDTFRKANELKEHNAIQQNRIKDVQTDISINVGVQFQLGTVSIKYADPYKQAEYAYSQIKEVSDE